MNMAKPKRPLLDLLRTSIQKRPRILFKGIFSQEAGYVSGYWQLTYTVPRGGAQACFARLYDRTDNGESGQLEFNLNYLPDIGGWEIDIGVLQYRTPPPHPDPKTGPLSNPGFMEWHDKFTSHWEAPPYGKYDPASQFYFPVVPDDVLRGWFKLFEIDYTPPETVVVKLHVDGSQMKGRVIPDYFHGTVPPAEAPPEEEVPPEEVPPEEEVPPAAPPEEEVPPEEEAPTIRETLLNLVHDLRPGLILPKRYHIPRRPKSPPPPPSYPLRPKTK